ncbi:MULTISPECIES: helix-turn-helix transcriptional regulator [Streptomyces]|jgi:Predicted transcription factor, homolog of eukaryotic MBF1|uniref:Helix-turn-helix transcriptional regulator n=1 Tax=Streptomyces mirabilis TaxID=68239 RepID=A0ABU3UUL4_9ACTN|nr:MULTISPECIES: helix-turn-helix transcriptional regulator [Streptomyces]MCX4424443.1 helix-turn-helix domain-containing protein [Streptomyces mirabilis]MCX4608510.1 helix-turn-helix domain-containing protein [Streptomyces mirabilis]MCX5348994.1 helix-turn-helix domain-containing protein [Streptomyces mirabilis]MDU8997612.1 helix-turn-helix transcriptional regulator [Streptomyces mirabilis]QDN87528.1 helix-turn-helix domain-containing protein [Streptomyces sp. RLB3-6]
MVVDGAVGTGGEPESSDSLRTFGAVVQALREHAGLSREEFGERVRFSKHTVASVELGRRMPDPTFVERAEEVLGNTGALRKAAGHLARQPGLAAWFRQWARLETTAITLYTYECRLIPGLLQTEAYARQLFADRLPSLDDEQIEAQWTARAERQRLLRERPNTAFSFILEEHLFLRRTGGVEVTRELIDHVLEVSALRNVEVQVMPLVLESHAGMAGPLQQLETPDNKWYAYNEAQRGGLFFSDPKEISVLQRRYARMRSQALTLQDSVSLLERMRGAL